MVVAGEASGDLHGANLVRALKNIRTGLTFCGMGGPELNSAGVELLFDAEKIGVVGVVEIIFHLKDILLARAVLRNRLKNTPPDLLILIDFPDFNLMLAKQAKKLGIPVFYYITPQVWAWRSGRVKTIRERVDSIGVIYPFEEKFFRERGVAAHYVGHPLLDSVATTLSRKDYLQQLGIQPGVRCIGLLPGSRQREISSLLPEFLKAARLLQSHFSEKFVFFIPIAPTISMDDLKGAGIDSFRQNLDIRIITEERYEMMTACDAVVTASGTVTLELAILGVPMVVTYKLSQLTYLAGRMLIKLDYFSLVNLIAGEKVVPELLQHEVTAENIVRQLLPILDNEEKKRGIREALAGVRDQLGGDGASAKAAQIALRLLPK